MKISIAEPCHENWDAMTPNQQGAFCKSCAKDVVDFSKKTLEEIKDFFSKPKEGRVCGRFEESQLQELTFDDFFARFRYWNFSKKFATIFILAFGFWIFSNQGLAQNKRMMLKGDVAVEQNEGERNMIKGKIKATNCKPEKEPETIKKVVEPEVIKEERMLMGMVAYRPIEKKDPEIKTPVLIDEEVDVKEVKNEEIIEEVKNVIEETNDTPPIDIDIEEPEVIVISVISEINTIEVEDEVQLLTIPTETETIQPEEVQEQKILAEEKDALLYPNPNKGNFVVEVGHKQVLRMYDPTGKEILAQEVEGRTKINTTSLTPGMYIVTFSDMNHIITKKVIVTD